MGWLTFTGLVFLVLVVFAILDVLLDDDGDDGEGDE
jgi:hypothetical protein